MTADSEPSAGLFRQEHRLLDEMIGRFLAALEARDSPGARETIEAFDASVRRHTQAEEERLYPPPAGPKLAPSEAEGERERLFRELRLEHVQIRELSGMVVRLLVEKGDLDSARRLLPNLMRRWDAHTQREEREVFKT